MFTTSKVSSVKDEGDVDYKVLIILRKYFLLSIYTKDTVYTIEIRIG